MTNEELIELANRILVEVLRRLDEVIDGASEHMELPLIGVQIPPDKIQAHMTAKGFAGDGAMETNGWLWDWWLTYKRDGKNYVITHGGMSYTQFMMDIYPEESTL